VADRSARSAGPRLETGSAITWEATLAVSARELISVGEVLISVALTNNRPAGLTPATRLIHVRPRKAVSTMEQGISAGHSSNSYRGLVQIRGPRRWVRKELQPVRFRCLIAIRPPPTRTPHSAPSSRRRSVGARSQYLSHLCRPATSTCRAGIIGFEGGGVDDGEWLLPRCVNSADGLCRRSRTSCSPSNSKVRRLNALHWVLPL